MNVPTSVTGVLTGPASHRSLREPNSFAPSSLFPGVFALREYDRTWLRPDLLAGVTVAAYLIPQVMAYAQMAGLPAGVGLFAVIGPGIAYAIFGTSRHLSLGPESTIALMSATALTALAGRGTEAYASLAAALAIVVGLLCVIGWFLGLGFIGDLLSRPVLIGYMAGVAVLMIVSQITALTGIPATGESIVGQIVNAVQHGGQFHGPTVALAVALLAYLFISAKVIPKAPNPLIAVLLGAAAVTFLSLQDYGIKVVGAIPHGLPTPSFPGLTWDGISAMLLPALGLAIVGYSESVIGARAFAEDDDPPVRANQEFLALGAANAAAGLTGGFPVSSSASRAAIGQSMGSKTQLYSLVAVATVVAASFVLGPVLAAFPKAALGALVVYAGTHLVNTSEIRRIARFRRSELVLLLATTLGVLLAGVLSGILIAVTLSLGDLLRRVARGHDAVLGYVPGLAGMHDVDDYPLARQVPGMVVYRYDSPLFFANAEDFYTRAMAAVDDAGPEVEWLVVNAESNVEVDLTSLDVLERLRTELGDRGITLAMARVKNDLLLDLRKTGFAERVGEDYIFPTLPQAVRAYLKGYKSRTGHLPPGIRGIPRKAKPPEIVAEPALRSDGLLEGQTDP